MTARKHSIAFCGGAYGDEGKGRIVDKYVSDFAKKRPVVVYRDNGGAGAGHTVELDNGVRISFHQLPSGIFIKNTTVVLGKGMVIHPADLVEEITQVQKVIGGKIPARILIDEMATLSLDTHRAFEAVLKQWQEGGKGSTGRGMSPAYADIVLRHPLRIRDLMPFNTEKVKKHYALYEALVSGLGQKLATVKVPRMKGGELGMVGTLAEFTKRLQEAAVILKPYVANVHDYLEKTWADPKIAFVFEKANAVGLHMHWGVYPDVNASETTFSGIYSSSEGIIDPQAIRVRAAVIKATYMSSVGARKLPTRMTGKLADRIREDAHEYGATTKRPRDIAYLDMPALRYFSRVGQVNRLILTHMDVAYENTPIKVCVGYTLKGKSVGYRPDQTYLDTVKPVYVEMKPWSAEKIRGAKTRNALPTQAKAFIKFVTKEMGIPVKMITTGPKREQGMMV